MKKLHQHLNIFLEKINANTAFKTKNEVSTKDVLMLGRPSEFCCIGSSPKQDMHPQFGKWLPGLGITLCGAAPTRKSDL